MLKSTTSIALLLALSGCTMTLSSGVDTRKPNPGQLALERCGDAADDANDNLDELVEGVADGEVSDGELAEVRAQVDEARAALVEAARTGGCVCDFEALASAIDGGDTALAPILEGCDAASADAIAASQSATPGVCEDLAHNIANLEERVDNTDEIDAAFEAAREACDQAYAEADTQLESASAALDAACEASSEACEAALEDNAAQNDAIFAAAQATCDAAYASAEAVLSSFVDNGESSGGESGDARDEEEPSTPDEEEPSTPDEEEPSTPDEEEPSTPDEEG